ncbi:glutathione S-transferase family protein [Arboricoccus pini]|uniref:glutathione S-transferase family protein n=1 Tax=Arboricoccus pini TaxID=1963835 RepID=UPI0010558BE2|nr:glutathione S-transferase family protein [Arboricoccus pini]
MRRDAPDELPMTMAEEGEAPELRTSMVRLVQFPQIWGMNASPFCLKLETWLRLAGLPFEIRASINTQKAPKGKLPFIVDGGQEIGDSTLIIEHLKATRGIDPDAGLDRHALATACAFQRLFEDHLYYIIAYSRWVDPEGWSATAPAYFTSLPAALRPFGKLFIRNAIRRQLYAQGISRHRPDEVYDMARRDFEAVAAQLNTHTFFLGEQLTTIDAVAYGFLANIVKVPVETGLKRAALEFPELVQWCETMEGGLYGDP